MAVAGEDGEEPFQLITRKWRAKPCSRPRPKQLKSVSNSTGAVTGPMSGFAYASASSSRRTNEGEEESEKRSLQRANEAADVFVGYLGSAFEAKLSAHEKEEGVRSFAQSMRDAFEQVWPLAEAAGTNSNGDGKGKGKAVVPSRIVCLGLGSPSTSRGAQVQLALLVVLRRWLLLCHQDSHIDVVAFDPIFTASDRTLLTKHDIEPVSSETAQEWYTHPITTPTLLYMPHCDKELYEAVLSLSHPPDSSLEQPPPIVLLSNVLKNYTTFSTKEKLEASAPTLARLITAFLDPVQLPNWETSKRSALGPAANEQVNLTEFARLWDRNALRELGFHWLT